MTYVFKCRTCGNVVEDGIRNDAMGLDLAMECCTDPDYRRDYRAEAVNVDKGSLR